MIRSALQLRLGRRLGCRSGRAVTAKATARRWLSIAVGRQKDAVPVDKSSSGKRQDDALLRLIFDSPEVWKSFGKQSGRRNVGLLCNAYLTEPEGFVKFAEVSLARARTIVDTVLKASTLEEYGAIVRQMDRLSDVLCRVLDSADFVRVTHPDLKTQRLASEAWDMVYHYMNELNTMTGLNEQLGRAMENENVTSKWSEEEMTVARVLKMDFLKSAVNLPDYNRKRFVELSSEISQKTVDFVSEMMPEQTQVWIASEQLTGMDPVMIRDMPSRLGRICLPTSGAAVVTALRTVRDSGVREQIYRAMRTASSQSIGHLEQLVRLRAELAELSGFESYSHLSLRDRMMAKSPESVAQFLHALSQSNQALAKREVDELLAEKKKDQGSDAILYAWDKEYYTEAVRRSMKSSRRHDDFLPAYFSLGSVMQGLSRVFSHLYGIRFVPRETMAGETWHPDVRRLDVESDTDGHVAVLYCDLFYRQDKSPNPAHFTLRCSREITESELAELAKQRLGKAAPVSFDSLDQEANDGMATSRGDGRLKQLPTIALVCDFPQTASSSTRPALLSFSQLETLFHEMGHAIHSVLARTSFQNVAGTRCATDLAELPSTLMEYLAADASVLALFARHHETDQPLPYEMVADKLREAGRFQGMETENQIILAILDQELHSRRPSEPDFDSTDIYHDVQRRYGTEPHEPAETRWQGFFGHLGGYGSSYYSYLFDRVLAQRVWNVVFSSGQDGAALDRANGERLKEKLLKWGGSRDPWKCLSAVLGDDRLAEGGEEAMALVGSWGSKQAPVLN